jgi:hypothetical protein
MEEFLNPTSVANSWRGQQSPLARFVATTDSDHNYPIFPNLAKNMKLDGPNQLWVADITYV